MISLAIDDTRLAEAYDRLSDSQFESGSMLLEKLGLRPGQTVVDVGCGTGRLGAAALERIGPGGRLIGIDPLPERVAIATRRVCSGNARFHTGRGEDLSAVESAVADVVYMSAVFHWVEDKPRALGEIKRVLRPGGRLGLTTNSKELGTAMTLSRVTASVLSRAPYREHVGAEPFAPFRNGVTTTELIRLLVKAGFTVDDLQIVPLQRCYGSGETILDFVESSTFGNYLEPVPARLRDQARGEIVAELEKARTNDGISLQQHTLFAVARKPLFA